LKNWMGNPELLASGRGLFDRAKADAAQRLAERGRLEEERVAADAIRIAANNAPILALMPPRHREICGRRVAGETLQMIATDFGITRERVRQIEATWRVRGLIVPGAAALSDATIRRASPTGLQIDWSSKIEAAFRAIPE
jgi:hypothetical protein